MPMLKRKKGEKKSAQGVRTAMHEFKRGKLHSGSKKGPVVKNRKQAVAIGLNEARKAGAAVPKPKRASKKKDDGVASLQSRLQKAHGMHQHLRARADVARAHVDMLEAKAKMHGHEIRYGPDSPPTAYPSSDMTPRIVPKGHRARKT